MIIVCEYCGTNFAVYDNLQRKYCPDCQHSSKRYNEQFQVRKRNDIVLKIYTANYSKRHALFKKGKISKEMLDSWRKEAKINQHELSIGKITIEDFTEWCNSSYMLIRGGVKQNES